MYKNTCLLVSILMASRLGAVANVGLVKPTRTPVLITNSLDKTIGGVVLDEKNLPLPGVSVKVKGASTGTVTDINGKFSLSVPDNNAVLVFSFIGYTTREVPVGGKTTFRINLSAENSVLSDVVVVAYGTQRKTSSTAAVSQVKGAEAAKSPTPNISGSIAGRVSGVSMRGNGGQPGQDNPSIYIRGVASTGNTNPLIVVDGIIRDNINQVDPNTIESISVLKDAAAVAPYGMGGANGVLLITTKSGVSGAPTISLNAYYGTQTPTVYPDMVNATEYMKIRNEAALNSGATTLPYAEDLINNYDELHAADPDKYPNSNFFRDVVDLHVPLQNYNFQLNGGTDKVKYFTGLGFYDQGGMFGNVGYKRYTYSLKTDVNATSTTKITASLNGSIERTSSTNEYIGNVIWASVKMQPTGAIRYSNGLPGAVTGISPLGLVNGGYANTRRNTLLTSIAVEQQLSFIKGLSVKGTFSFDPTQSTNKNWHLPITFYDINTTTTPYTFTKAIAGGPRTTLYQAYSQNENFTYQGIVNYNRTFGKHGVSGLFVAESRRNTNNYFNAARNNFAISVDELDLGSATKEDFDNGGGSGTGSQIGYVFRLGYNYDGKYLLEASGRQDGHYAFGPGKRFGFFPAVSAGWRISEETFFKERFGFIENLKLRGSWGRSGNLPYQNGNLALYQWLNGYTLGSNAYVFGASNIVQGAYVPVEANPNITWEIAEKTDIGFDLSLRQGLLNFEFDYFAEQRKNMLIPPTVTVPLEYGISLPLENAGIMKNRGVEFSVGSTRRFKNGMQAGLTGNFSYARNKLVQTFENASTYNNPNRRQTGRPLNTPFGYKSLGLFSTDDDVNKDGLINAADGYMVNQFNAELRPGDIRYADLNGDGQIDPEDQTVVGYPTYPQITYGFTPTFAWKGLDVSLFFQGAARLSLNVSNFQTVPFANNASNLSYEYYNNYWTPERQDAKYPRVTSAPTLNNSQYSDFYMMNTSYLRLKNLVVGYTLPGSISKKAGMKTARIYVSGQNVLTFSKLKYMDPEEAAVNTSGTYFYPNQKMYTLGLNVNF
ncbi:SusC/RagA family TonB-linked outer membrane protein [Desertivirga brevis]|uniref:SusC/RagA family TonB-linked outer membrane protein n=1 Tax=Desertivirga brevis TaxID=2810310 RepID=UPI001A959B17|nr:TonB-dependent receptor [Pedobacter sp. SYSU D00873]